MDEKTQPGRNGGTLKRGNNPKPKGAVSLTGELKRQLAQGQNLKELITAAIEQAKQGNSANLKLIFDRIEGPVKERIEHSFATMPDEDLIAAAREQGIIGE